MSKSAENTGQSTQKKGRIENLRPPWPKGVSGNPGGRPKKTVLSDALKAQLEMTYPGDRKGRTYAEVIAEKACKSAAKGSVHALSEIGDRTEGRPRQAVEMSGNNGGPIDLNITSLADEALDQEITNLVRSLGVAIAGSSRSQASARGAAKGKGKTRR